MRALVRLLAGDWAALRFGLGERLMISRDGLLIEPGGTPACRCAYQNRGVRAFLDIREDALALNTPPRRKFKENEFSLPTLQGRARTQWPFQEVPLPQAPAFNIVLSNIALSTRTRLFYNKQGLPGDIFASQLKVR